MRVPFRLVGALAAASPLLVHPTRALGAQQTPPAALPPTARPASSDSAISAVPAPAAAVAPAAASNPSPVPAPAPAAAPVLTAGPFTVSGELRTRSELARAGGSGSTDTYTFVRSRVGARAARGEHLRVVLGLQSNRTVDAHPAAGSEASIDLFEGYLELRAAAAGTALAVRGGRQELALANERLIGRRNWANVKHSFDGVRLLATPAVSRGAATPAWSATAFAVSPADHSRPSTAPAGGARHLLLGFDAVRPLPLSAATLETFVVHDRGVRTRTREVVGRTTVAGRLRAPRLGVIGLDLEGTVQGGTQHLHATAAAPAPPMETIRAWMLGARLSTASGAPRPVSAALGADLLSGDGDATDRRYGAFDTLYGSNHGFYGVADIAGGNPASTLRTRGLLDVLATTTVVATRRVSARADLHRMLPMHGGGALGWELDLLAPVRLVTGTTLEAGYSMFRAGAAGAALGLGTAGHTRGWAYLQFTAGF